MGVCPPERTSEHEPLLKRSSAYTVSDFIAIEYVFDSPALREDAGSYTLGSEEHHEEEIGLIDPRRRICVGTAAKSENTPMLMCH